MRRTKPTPNRRVFGYARVSSQEQAIGTSLQDQIDAIARHAKGLGLSVTHQFTEAESAVHEKIERRVQIHALIRELAAGDLVLVHRLDRWSRDPEFTYKSVRELLAKGASFYSVEERCDPSTSEGDTMLGFRILFAREEHKRIKARLVGTRKTLRDAGYYVEGLPPYGYKRQDKKGVERNVLVIEPVAAAKIRKAFALSIDGHSLSEIERIVGVEKSTVHKALRSRHYLGEVRDSSGHWIKGRHASIIDARSFAKSNGLMAARNHAWSKLPDANAQTADWWLRDIARCGVCGSKMAAAYGQRNKTGSRGYYFACIKRCTRRYVNVQRAEEMCEPIIVAHLEGLRDELLKPPTPIESEKVIVDVDARRLTLQRKRERLLEQNADGFLSREALREKMAKLDVERTKLDAITSKPLPPSPKARAAALKAVAEIARAWGKMRGEKRRELVRLLAKSVGLAADQAPKFEWMTADELAERSES